MRPEELLSPTPAGLCCRPGGFHIDPVRPVARALITHGHSDHARSGHGAVLATPETIDLMRLRYGENFAGSVQPIRSGEPPRLDGVTVSFHRPAMCWARRKFSFRPTACAIRTVMSRKVRLLMCRLIRLTTNSHLGGACAAPNAYFIAAKASTTGRLLTVIMPPPG
jgi:L-ascorbate metabolism protein UlaG (beta-lactamase superfamily)